MTAVCRLWMSIGFVAASAGAFAATQTVSNALPPQAAIETDQLLDQARTQYDESVRLYRTDRYAEAQSLGERALETRERLLGSDHQDVAASLMALGRICSARAEYERALALLHSALSIQKKTFGADHVAVAEVLDALAQNQIASGQFAEAERLGKQALEIREEHLGANDVLAAASLGTLADVYLAKGEFRNAKVFADRALEIAGKAYGPDDLTYAEFLHRAGSAEARLSSFPRAEELLSNALRIRERVAGAASLAAADSLSTLAFVSYAKSDHVKSEQIYRQALAIKEKAFGRDHFQLTGILNQLGLLSYRRSDYSAAEAHFTRAIAIAEASVGGSHPRVAQIMNNLGLVYWKRGDYSKAADVFRRVLELEEKIYGPESVNVAGVLGNLGNISKNTGDYESAETYYRRELAIKERILGAGHPETRHSFESLGILYRDRGDYARAEPMFLRTVEIAERSLGPEHPDLIRHFHNLAHLYAAKGNVENALKFLRRVSALEEENLPLNLAVGSERQKLAYFGPFADTLEKIISFHLTQDAGDADARDLAATTLLQRKGRILDAMADNLGALRRRATAEDLRLLDQFSTVTAQLATLVLNGPQRVSIADHQQRIEALTEQRDTLEDALSRRTAGYFERADAVTLARIEAAIPADAALVEFAIYRPYDPKQALESTNRFADPRYVVYVIRNSGDVCWRDLGSAREIDELVEMFRDALRDPNRRDTNGLARRLHDRIMQPVRALTGAATRLLISPDGQLDLIPFEALVDEEGHYLIERYSISYLTAGRDLLRMQVPRVTSGAPVVVANPVFGEPAVETTDTKDRRRGKHAERRIARRSITTGTDLSAVYFAALAGTRLEASTIQSLFPEARVLTGTAASEAALKHVDAPHILHIATHGFFLQSGAIANPLLRSGLALSGANLNPAGNEDGILTALEASSLNLWGTKLVTLSACDTGVGEVKVGEGVYGLRRAFFLAGAETLVMSLWPVSDAVTREMMTAYYTGLKQGLGRGEALRQAQLAMLTHKNRQHPFYWASFIQAGEWANLDGHR